MGRARMRDPLYEGFENYDPTINPTEPEGELESIGTGGYTPPNGNTGISGYGFPNGLPMPTGGPVPSGVKQRAPYSTGGYQPTAAKPQAVPEESEPEFNGDYAAYFKSILGSGPTNMQRGLDNQAALEKYGGKLQIASDGTWRGRINDIPGIGSMTLIGDRQTWGDGDWAFRTGSEQYGSGGGGGGGGSQTPGPTAASNPELWDKLKSLFDSGGGFNQDVVNRRSENAGAALRRDAKSRVANNEAYLASRGLIGDGPQGTAFNKVQTDTAEQYADALSGIYADESENADERMMGALSMMTGMSTADADRALGYLRANNDFSLGQGSLALGNFEAQNNYNLGLGNFGLRRDELQHAINSGNIDQMIELLKIYMGGANTSAGGHF
jgi:hypothetical protein